MATDLLAELTLENFAACVDEAFDVAMEENGAPVTQLMLVSAKELGPPSDANGRIPFSLTFEGTSQVPLEQGIHWLKRSNLGELGIFIVPISEKGNIRSYEAIFS
jgi:hypothetical protein